MASNTFVLLLIVHENGTCDTWRAQRNMLSKEQFEALQKIHGTHYVDNPTAWESYESHFMDAQKDVRERRNMSRVLYNVPLNNKRNSFLYSCVIIAYDF